MVSSLTNNDIKYKQKKVLKIYHNVLYTQILSIRWTFHHHGIS